MPGKLVAAIAHPDAQIKETFSASQSRARSTKSEILMILKIMKKN